jgi:hypothetical protein
VAVGVAPTSVEVAINQTVDVAVEVKDIRDLYGFDVALAFDPQTVEVIDADPGTDGVQIALGTFLDPGFVIINEANNQAGSVRLAMTQINPSQPKTGTGALVVVKLKGKQARAASPLTLVSAQLARRDGIKLTTALAAGQITVNAQASSQPTPTSIPAQGAGIGMPTDQPTSALEPAPTELPTSTVEPTSTELPANAVVAATATPEPTTAPAPPTEMPPAASTPATAVPSAPTLTSSSAQPASTLAPDPSPTVASPAGTPLLATPAASEAALARITPELVQPSPTAARGMALARRTNTRAPVAPARPERIESGRMPLLLMSAGALIGLLGILGAVFMFKLLGQQR